ncbi:MULTISPECIES: aromatic-ring-hydroxylating dioxygenase subunit beta [Nocardia]|uniref:aromatic-ring-hydroxylating dioxygenase subunit beta n=1 Tax=Nocardia TaxID=1817 RepID=UPI000D688EC6|nr:MULTISPECIES: aromatic-ring-hydroxylating dioxygenase subunit beta [Nocardia]
MTETATPVQQGPVPDFGVRVSSGDPRYHRIVDWLHDETALLDGGHTIAWTKLIAEDIVYRIPVRQTRLRDDTRSQFADNMFHYDENHTTLTMKILRLATTASPWCENPVSRSRRLVTNIRVFEGTTPDEFTVISSVLITRNRHSESVPLIMSGERNDVLRRDGSGFLLTRRTFLMDQSTVGFPNMTIIL